MKRLLLILILTFSFQSWTKADDIKEFEIEGVNIGDSLLDYFTKEKIESSTKTTYPNKKFYDIHITIESDQYDQLTYTVKNGDKKFIIEQLSGDKFYYKPNSNKNIDKMHLACLKQKNEISEEFEKMLSDTRRNDYKHTYKTIDNGKSFSVITDFEFKDLSAIRIYCNKFTKETTDKRNFFNGLSVSISPVKILNWLNNKAYKQ
jgi:hypothetical protein